jgi:hypothetical protein
VGGRVKTTTIRIASTQRLVTLEVVVLGLWTAKTGREAEVFFSVDISSK